MPSIKIQFDVDDSLIFSRSPLACQLESLNCLICLTSDVKTLVYKFKSISYFAYVLLFNVIVPFVVKNIGDRVVRHPVIFQLNEIESVPKNSRFLPYICVEPFESILIIESSEILI